MSLKPIKLPYQSIQEMKEAAMEVLPSAVSEYLNAGAASGRTMLRNQSAFQKWALIPKRLKGVEHPDTRVEIFGQSYDLPFGAAPVGMQQLFHKQGESATALACAHHKAPCILSTVSNISYAESSKESSIKPWFQLYPTTNFKITKQLIENVEAAGAEVIVLTVDVPVLGKRKHNARALLSHPDYKHLAFGNLKETLKAEDDIHHPGLNWDLFEMIKETTSCKILLKGILHPDDALQGKALGADGIIISNHGGRQMDSHYSTIEALANIRKAIPEEYPLFLDGGIRCVEDLLKALSLGAKMVFLGRPVCYGLALGGRAGVDHLWNILKVDLIRSMQLMGMADLKSIDSSQIVKI